MRLFTKSLLAGAVLFGALAPAAMAEPPRFERHYDHGRYDHHDWRVGERFDRRYHYVVVNDWGRYHLRRPPPGHYYYRTDAGDILLVAAATGAIVWAANHG